MPHIRDKRPSSRFACLRAEKIIEILKKNQFEILIVNGDLFDTNETRNSKKTLGNNRKYLGKSQRDTKCFLSAATTEEIRHFGGEIGMELQNEYAFTLGDNRFLCLHGDEFDMFVKHLPLTKRFFARLYYLIQKISGKKQKTPVVAKMLMKKILGIPRRQERLALKRGATDGSNVVICSHTHIPHMETKNGILFINSGSFCDNPSNYVAISSNGETELVGV